MPKSAAQQFADLQRLPAAQAVAYLQDRGQLTKTFSWQDLWKDENAQQFTVSRLARLDLLKALQDGITLSVQGDLSRRDWMRDAEALLAKEGWWGEKDVLDEFTGKMVKTRFDPSRLKLIFDTNTRMAYSAGLWERVEANKDTHPYIRYITKGDERVRLGHRRWANLTLPVGDPFWKTHWPPNAFRCRCRAMSMTAAEYNRRKAAGTITTEAPPEALQTFVNQRTGEVSQVPSGVAPGFDYNVGVARATRLGQIAAEKIAAAPEPLARAAVADGMNIAKAVEGQPTWVTLGRPDFRAMNDLAEPAPALIPGAANKAAAIDAMRQSLGVAPGGSLTVTTPIEQVAIDDLSFPHVVEKRADQRERFAGFVIPTLLRPTEVWAVKYDDGSVRNRYLKLFSESKYDLLIMVKIAPDGSVFWNMMQRDRKGMNTLRIGDIIYKGR